MHCVLAAAVEVQEGFAGTENEATAGAGVPSWMSVLYANHWTADLPDYVLSCKQNHQLHGKFCFRYQHPQTACMCLLHSEALNPRVDTIF